MVMQAHNRAVLRTQITFNSFFRTGIITQFSSMPELHRP